MGVRQIGRERVLVLFLKYFSLGFPWAVQVGEDGNCVETIGNGRDGQVVMNQPLKHLIGFDHF